MDGFAESMIARGPTLAADPEIATGSLHVLGLPSVEAAKDFVAREPNNLAGVYAEHSIWRFENLLGRTMWELPGATDGPKLLIIARGLPEGGSAAPPDDLRELLILYGTLSTLDDAQLVGVALAAHARDREAVSTLVDDFAEIETHSWEFGGRR